MSVTVRNPYLTYTSRITPGLTPQTEAIVGTVPNNEGGQSYPLNEWDKLDRFLILGTVGGTYYTSEQKLTQENAKDIKALIAKDGVRAVLRAVTLSEQGRTPKQSPVLFCLALCLSFGDRATKRAVVENLPRAAHIPTHLMEFVSYASSMRGWGRTMRDCVSNWYTSQDTPKLGYLLPKYQNREGYTNRDLLRLSHAKPTNGTMNILFHWATKGWESVGAEEHPDKDLRQIWAFERMKLATTEKEVVKLILDYNLPRECIPTKWLTDPVVWDALLHSMPITAEIKNLATMSRIGLLTPLSDASKKVVADLGNEERLKAARVHPIQVLSAYRVYAQGVGVRSHGAAFTPVQQITDALDEAFYLAFKNVEPSNKNILLGLDVSGSMAGGEIAGVAGLTPRDACAAMALVTARTEPNYVSKAFTTTFSDFPISRKDTFDSVMNRMNNQPYGGTDCSLPMQYALQANLPVDAFVIYTDSETYAGNGHPSQWLNRYRQKMGRNAKLVVVGLTSTGFTIADPTDKDMLDVVGFDSHCPNLVSSFVRGDI